MTVSYKRWDSSFWQMKIAEVKLNPEESFSDENAIKLANSYDFLYVFSCKKLENLTISHFYEERIIYRLELTPNTTIRKDYPYYDKIIPYSGPVTESLKKIALRIGKTSRFSKDPYLNHKWQKLYTIWLEKSLSGELADIVFVCKIDTEIALITAKYYPENEKLNIILVGVDEEYSGKGIGKGLCTKPIEYALQNNYKKITVTTQGNNELSRKTYENVGFQIYKVLHLYHINLKML